MAEIYSKLTAALRLIGLLLWILAWTPALIASRLMRREKWVMAVTRNIYRGLVAICAFKIVVIGAPCDRHPVLYVANHCSYFDIMVLGSLLEAGFVAKQEVAGWPGIGPLARIAGTVFVERRARHSRTQRDTLNSRLAGRQGSLILFPEGTSSSGLSVLPFKSALFSVAEQSTGRQSTLPVQPISVAYTGLDGLPMGRNWRSHFAWYGDMELASHIWIALGLGRATVTITFHAPVTLEQWGSRKRLADYCYSVVKAGVVAANSGMAVRSPSAGSTEGLTSTTL